MRFRYNKHHEQENVCRILYTVKRHEVASKKVSASWAKKEFPHWKSLIETAESWEYGKEMRRENEAKEFIQFVVDRVRKNYRNG